jgi:ribosomal protein S18 acetylase RimI-like enzyme
VPEDQIVARILDRDDFAVLSNVAEGVFDGPIDPRWAAQFLDDQRHHMAVAIVEGQVVGMSSAIHYVHPDKPPELWVNEIGVAPPHRRRGIASKLLKVLFAHARSLGCSTAWVLTEEDNVAARRLYASFGGSGRRVLEFDISLDASPI